MAVKIFAVTSTNVRDAHFPQLTDFTANSKPTATQVGSFITEEAADLCGLLLQKGITAATLSDDAGVNYPNAYAWCQKTIKLAAAIRVFPAITGQDAAILKRWQETLDKRYEDLADSGYAALGDAPAPATSATGPRSHVVDHSLNTGSEADMSDVIPKFRRNQVL